MVLLSSLLTLGAIEVALRIASPSRYYVWEPGVDVTFYPTPEILPGVHGEGRFTTNDLGIRGRSFSDDDTYRILAVGGSTTESLFLDDTETWTHLLEQNLNQRFPDSRVWVGNVGKSGRSARAHLLQVEKLLPQYPRIDAVLVLAGINDLMYRLRRADEYRPLAEESAGYQWDLLQHAFHSPPELVASYPFHKRTAVWEAARRLRNRLGGVQSGVVEQDTHADYLVGVRRERGDSAPFVEVMPDLTEALEDYARTLHGIVTILEDQGVTPVLATQPSIWRDDLPPALEALLWFGPDGRTHPDSQKFFSAGALADGMGRHNEVLRSVCEERSITCIDLASVLPKDESIFYDDVHFNEEGSRRVAALMLEGLAQDPTISAGFVGSGSPDRPSVKRDQ